MIFAVFGIVRLEETGTHLSILEGNAFVICTYIFMWFENKYVALKML